MHPLDRNQVRSSSPSGRSSSTPARRALLALATLATLQFPTLSRAQVGWQQNEFVIGTWLDPQGDGSAAENRNRYQQARDAYFNLVTGTPRAHYGSSFTNPDYVPQHSKLDAGSTTGMKVLLTDDHWFAGMATTDIPDSVDPAIPPQVFAMYSGANITSAQNNALFGYTTFDEPAWDSANNSKLQRWLKDWWMYMHQNDQARGDGHLRATYVNFQPGCVAGGTCFQDFVTQYCADPNPLRRPDVASIDLYPFTGPTSNPTIGHWYFVPLQQLHDVMSPRPIWTVSLAQEGGNSSNPDANQFRWMTFGPIAAGAKGIIWFNYMNGSFMPTDPFDMGPYTHDAVVNYYTPTCKYYTLRTINHFVKSVVGPVVMSSTYDGLYHQNAQPTYEPFRAQDMIGSTYANAHCPVTAFTDPNLAAAVFHPNSAPTETYLLVLNKALTAVTSNVTLNGSYVITKSPSVVGYVGGTTYSPVGTGSSFSVSLAGGEGRLFRLTSTPQSTFVLNAPAGGESWLPNTTQNVSWSGNPGPVSIYLYADATEAGDEITGPFVTLATNVAGTSTTITLPNMLSHQARIVVASTDAGGVVRRVWNQNPISIVTAPPSPPPGYQSFGSAHCFGSADLTVGANGTAHLVYRDGSGNPFYASNSGTGWSVSSVWNVLSIMAPSITTDYAGSPHMFYYSVKERRLDYSFNTGSGWACWQIDNAPSLTGNTSMTRGPDGYMWVAYNSADATQGVRNVKIRRSYYGSAGGWQLWGPTAGWTANDPQSISIGVDSGNLPWVAYIERDPTMSTMKVVKYTTSTATVSLTQTGVFDQVSLAIDGSGRPCIAYGVRSGGTGGYSVFYKSYNGSTWSSPQLVDPSLGTVSGLSLKFRAGIPCVAWTSNGVAKYAEKSGSSWALSTVATPNVASGAVTLGFSSTGARYLGYLDRSLDVYRVAGPASGSAIVTTIETGEERSEAPSVEVRFANPLPRDGQLLFDVHGARSGRLSVSLLDIAGRRVASRTFDELQPGGPALAWSPGRMAPGVYFVRSQIGDLPAQTKRLLVVR